MSDGSNETEPGATSIKSHPEPSCAKGDALVLNSDVPEAKSSTEVTDHDDTVGVSKKGDETNVRAKDGGFVDDGQLQINAQCLKSEFDNDPNTDTAPALSHSLNETGETSFSEDEMEDDIQVGRLRRRSSVSEDDEEDEDEFSDPEESDEDQVTEEDEFETDGESSSGEDKASTASIKNIPNVSFSTAIHVEEKEDTDDKSSIDESKKKLHIEDKKNPAYVPRAGAFYMHDMREDSDDGEGKKPNPIDGSRRESRRPGILADRWQHDRFDPDEQAPRGNRELIRRYGYNIREQDVGIKPEPITQTEQSQFGPRAPVDKHRHGKVPLNNNEITVSSEKVLGSRGSHRNVRSGARGQKPRQRRYIRDPLDRENGEGLHRSPQASNNLAPSIDLDDTRQRNCDGDSRDIYPSASRARGKNKACPPNVDGRQSNFRSRGAPPNRLPSQKRDDFDLEYECPTGQHESTRSARGTRGDARNYPDTVLERRVQRGGANHRGRYIPRSTEQQHFSSQSKFQSQQNRGKYREGLPQLASSSVRRQDEETRRTVAPLPSVTRGAKRYSTVRQSTGTAENTQKSSGMLVKSQGDEKPKILSPKKPVEQSPTTESDVQVLAHAIEHVQITSPLPPSVSVGNGCSGAGGGGGGNGGSHLAPTAFSPYPGHLVISPFTGDPSKMPSDYQSFDSTLVAAIVNQQRAMTMAAVVGNDILHLHQGGAAFPMAPTGDAGAYYHPATSQLSVGSDGMIYCIPPTGADPTDGPRPILGNRPKRTPLELKDPADSGASLILPIPIPTSQQINQSNAAS